MEPYLARQTTKVSKAINETDILSYDVDKLVTPRYANKNASDINDIV